tara:strand:+ start:247 stop:513 length:267 start_codon:yes stop_codon:yes gene_type:complete
MSRICLVLFISLVLVGDCMCQDIGDEFYHVPSLEKRLKSLTMQKTAIKQARKKLKKQLKNINKELEIVERKIENGKAQQSNEDPNIHY